MCLSAVINYACLFSAYVAALTLAQTAAVTFVNSVFTIHLLLVPFKKKTIAIQFSRGKFIIYLLLVECQAHLWDSLQEKVAIFLLLIYNINYS